MAPGLPEPGVTRVTIGAAGAPVLVELRVLDGDFVTLALDK
jgi:hypothetical protein